jgi:hypothetical protein
MGAGFWWITVVRIDVERVKLTSAAPWTREIADLQRAHGKSHVCVRPLDACADVQKSTRVSDAPKEELDTALSTFIAFMTHFQDVSAAFPNFAWTVRAGWRGCATHQTLAAPDVRRTLACWDEVIEAVLAPLRVEAAAGKTNAGTTLLDVCDLNTMETHLVSAKAVFAYAAHQGLAVDIAVAFD